MRIGKLFAIAAAAAAVTACGASPDFPADFTQAASIGVKDGRIVLDGFSSSYQPDLCRAEDGALKLVHNSKLPKSDYQCFQLADKRLITDVPPVLAAEWRVKVTEDDALPGFGVSIGAARPGGAGVWEQRLFFTPTGVIRSGKPVESGAFRKGDFNTFRAALDTASGRFLLWINGVLAVDAATGSAGSHRKAPFLIVGDGSGDIAGAAELEYFRIGGAGRTPQIAASPGSTSGLLAGKLPKYPEDFAPTANPDFKLSTTIDFLDYAFYDKNGPAEYYSLESYEERIRMAAMFGVRKIYLRVNVCGLSLYPSRVTWQYGQNGAMHWTEDPRGAERLVNTLKRYDPCVETIRLGHKYNMEVWAWENLWDSTAVPVRADTVPGKFREIAEKLEYKPLEDPFFRENPDCYAMPLPADPIEKATVDAAARRYPVAKIEIVSGMIRNDTPVVAPESVVIATSSDNRVYRKLEHTYHCAYDREPDGAWKLVITGLNISEPYVKISHPARQGRNWCIAVTEQQGQSRVWNTRGELIHTVWATDCAPGGDPATRPLHFADFETAAWDYGNYSAGFVVGLPPTEAIRFNIVEYSEPKAMAHMVARFTELAKYDFDGFMFNPRTHSRALAQSKFGFNKSVRDKYLARYGVDIWRERFDIGKWLEIRGEAVADFLKTCKAVAGKRPIFIAGWELLPYGERPPHRDGGHPRAGLDWSSKTAKVDLLPMLYPRFFADRSVDGVMMMGDNFAAKLRAIPGGDRIRIGWFRDNNYREYRVEEDVKNCMSLPELDELELYETMCYTKSPEAEKIRAVMIKQ